MIEPVVKLPEYNGKQIELIDKGMGREVSNEELFGKKIGWAKMEIMKEPEDAK